MAKRLGNEKLVRAVGTANGVQIFKKLWEEIFAQKSKG
ncbi:MAG: hypothetical protein SGJ10_01340 [Bacteroidota bacterium]|nr:hypothetical protein [Bacteroidota bacterium]